MGLGVGTARMEEKDQNVNHASCLAQLNEFRTARPCCFPLVALFSTRSCLKNDQRREICENMEWLHFKNVKRNPLVMVRWSKLRSFARRG